MDLVDSTTTPNKKRKIGGNKAKANKDVETKGHEPPLFVWSDVLHCLQNHAEKAAHKQSRLVEVNFSIFVCICLYLFASIFPTTAIFVFVNLN